MERLGGGDPARMGSYRLIARLGTGGMGQVFLARSERGRTVAVKVVRPDLAEQEEFRDRFRAEVAAARRVGGRWTAPVLDADTEAAVPWIATGYVAGPSLSQVVGRDHGPLPERSVRILAAGLAHALQDIHGAGIVHRDLKPSNVLVTIDGPRVIDFGIARALETVTDGGLTQAGALVGSPGFMAPEQVRGDRVTAAADVFCLGSVLAYAATGAQPFGAVGSGAHAMMFRIAQEEPDLTDVPAGLTDLLRACLRKNPSERPTPDQILEHTGVSADAIADGYERDTWLPGTLVAQLGRHAVRLLEFEEGEGAGEVLGVPGRPGTPGAAGVPGAARVPWVPGEPGTSGVSGAPGAAGIPGAPGMQSTPGAPGTAGTSGMPGAPSTSGTPGTPWAQGTAGLPGAPGMPGVAGTAGTAEVPGTSGAPSTSGTSGTPSTPGIPGAAGAPGAAGTAGAPGVPGPSGAPWAPGMQSTPGAPGMPGVAGAAGPVGVSGTPGASGIPGVGDGPPTRVVAEHAPSDGVVAQPAHGHPQQQPRQHPQPFAAAPSDSQRPPVWPGDPALEASEVPAAWSVSFNPGSRSGGGWNAHAPAPLKRSRMTLALGAAALVVALAAGASVVARMNGDDDTPSQQLTPTPTPTSSGGSASPDAGAVPSGYLGTWTASIDNSTGHNTRRLTITQGRAGDQVLTLVADGPTGSGSSSYHCVFEAGLAQQPTADAPLSIGPSKVTTAEPASYCTPGGATTLTLLPDGTLRRATASGGEQLTYTKES
ncbi:serine/threonine-protein kinase [Streptomyces geranii]|uniref:serine/threonine-protein kinase n=1 Tax=Streptomyces geranii TaxID=2058923 RepID=UPI000D042B63|nr:protein kinase [Streptomyces geranii]